MTTRVQFYFKVGFLNGNFLKILTLVVNINNMKRFLFLFHFLLLSSKEIVIRIFNEGSRIIRIVLMIQWIRKDWIRNVRIHDTTLRLQCMLMLQVPLLAEKYKIIKISLCFFWVLSSWSFSSKEIMSFPGLI